MIQGRTNDTVASATGWLSESTVPVNIKLDVFVENTPKISPFAFLFAVSDQQDSMTGRLKWIILLQIGRQGGTGSG